MWGKESESYVEHGVVEKKAIGVGGEWLVWEKNIVLIGIVRGCGCVL